MFIIFHCSRMNNTLSLGVDCYHFHLDFSVVIGVFLDIFIRICITFGGVIVILRNVV